LDSDSNSENSVDDGGLIDPYNNDEVESDVSDRDMILKGLSSCWGQREPSLWIWTVGFTREHT